MQTTENTRLVGDSPSLTVAEMTTARVIRDAARPKLDPDAYRSAIRESRATHGEDRHERIKFAALHMGLRVAR